MERTASMEDEPLVVARSEKLLATFGEPETAASLLRSEDMTLCEVIIEMEAIYNCIAVLGEISRVQFIDLNTKTANFKKTFASEVRQCDELERQIGRIEDQIKIKGIPINRDYGDVDVLTTKGFTKLQAVLQEYETELNDDASTIETLKAKRIELDQLRGIIELFEQYCSQLHFEKNQGRRRTRSDASSMLTTQLDITADNELRFVTGAITRKKITAFEKVLWRVGRGNIFVRSKDIRNESEDSHDHKAFSTVFVAVCHGASLKEKVEQICQSFNAKTYHCPLNNIERQKMLQEVMTERAEIDLIITKALELHQVLMKKIALSCRTWKIQVRKVKAVYHTMNMFTIDENHRYLIGQFWVPEIHFHHVDIILAETVGGEDTGDYVIYRLQTPRKNIPTYFQTNKVSKPFQNIVHAFSVAKYKEINPALFTTITFPFLFSVMFGDLGHGIIMVCFAAWMCIKEDKLKKTVAKFESLNMIFGGRYVVLLMGLFSIYAGLLFNDCFAKAFTIFRSAWHTNYTIAEIHSHERFFMDPNDPLIEDKWPYPFGDDPVWDTAENKVNFVNSMKMKLSIIFGVAQMLFGLFLSLLNHMSVYYFKKWSNIFCEFIPQLLFLSCLFVYMDGLIIFKWVYFNAGKANSAPSVLISKSFCISNFAVAMFLFLTATAMINMCLLKYSEETPADYFVYQNLMYVQYALILVAIMTVPWMLFIKPLYLNNKKKRKSRRQSMISTRSVDTDPEIGQDTLSQQQQDATTASPNIGSRRTSRFNAVKERRRISTEFGGAGKSLKQKQTRTSVSFASETGVAEPVISMDRAHSSESVPDNFLEVHGSTPDIVAKPAPILQGGGRRKSCEDSQGERLPPSRRRLSQRRMSGEGSKIAATSSTAPVSRRTTFLDTVEEHPHLTDEYYFESRQIVGRRATLATILSTRSQQIVGENRRRHLERKKKNEFDFGEVFIRQGIHTIEYVLGLISHTASYLRLWALSLAHSELSTVLWTMIFRRSLYMATSSYLGCLAIFITFIPWACLTLAILVMMEGMSAFLHALRLHWVEFQSKFYEGGGRLFQPFNFKAAYAT